MLTALSSTAVKALDDFYRQIKAYLPEKVAFAVREKLKEADIDESFAYLAIFLFLQLPRVSEKPWDMDPDGRAFLRDKILALKFIGLEIPDTNGPVDTYLREEFLNPPDLISFAEHAAAIIKALP